MAGNLYKLTDVKKDFVVGKVTVPGLRGIHLDIASSEIVALLGPSGSGKSTLLNTLGLIESPSSGEITFDGKVVSSMNERQLTEIRRRGVGFIFQSFNLIPILSAVENIEYALVLEGGGDRAAIRERAMRVVEQVGLTEFADHKPSELSGGQRQRVAIARAIVKEPQVVLADEPTANLDSKTAQQIMELIQSLNQTIGTTVIIATHDQPTAAFATRKVHIRDGVVADA